MLHLYPIPLIFALIGLAFYTVLGGADFGAGFWQLTAGKGRQAQAVTGARGIPVGYGTLVLVYVLLIAAVAWILWRLARKPLELEPSLSAAEVD